jgi:hypothetical protein
MSGVIIILLRWPLGRRAVAGSSVQGHIDDECRPLFGAAVPDERLFSFHATDLLMSTWS